MGNGIPFPGAFLKKSPWGSYNSNILANKYPVNDIVFWIKNQIIGDCRCLLEKKKRAAPKKWPQTKIKKEHFKNEKNAKKTKQIYVF